MTLRARTVVLLLLAALANTAPLRAQEAPTTVDADAVDAPVEIDGTVLFRVRGVSSYPAEVRADLIRKRIEEAAADPSVSVDSVTMNDEGAAVRIAAGHHLIMGVVDADAAGEEVSRPELAAAHMNRIKDAIRDYRDARTPAAIRRAAVNTAWSTAALAVTIGLLIWFWRAVDRLMRRRLQTRIHSVGIQSFEVMRADKIWAGLRNAMLAVRMIVFLGCLLVYLGFTLGQWPLTRGFARNIVAFASAPLQVIGRGLVSNIPRLMFLAVLFVVIRLALRIIRLFFEAVARGTVTLGGFDAEWAQPTYKIVRVAVVAFALIVAYPYIPGSESAAFKGVSLFIGIVFSLGSSSAVSNIMAGYMMTYRRAFKVGDRVKIGDAIGDVIQTRLQVTHLRSFKNEEILIPNSQILAGEVVNYSSLARLEPLLLHTEVGIGYETAWRRVEAMLLEAARRTSGLATDARAFVRLKRLGDFAITYELNVPCRDVPAMNALYTSLHQHILDVFNEEAVQIMTPAYEGDPPEPKIVAQKDWYPPTSSAQRDANVLT